jgi:molybdopterin molybdotransferase
MIPVKEAFEHVLAAAPRLAAEAVSLDRAIGRVLRESIEAPHDFPPFERVMMDGFAVRAADLAATDTLPMIGETAAGAAERAELAPGSCVQVMTGGPLPRGADAVVPVEETSRDGDRITFGRAVREGQHFAARGEEARAGETLLAAGVTLGVVGIANVGNSGRATVQVSRLPSLAVVSTGDELVAVDAEPGPHQIRDTNSWSLAAQAHAEGLTDVVRFHARDDSDQLRQVLGEALQRDIVVISGGVSMGKYDLVPGILAELGVEQVFHKVFQKPGKPLWFGTRGQTLVFGAPGNPLSTSMTFQLYVRLAIAKMVGRPTDDPHLRGVLTRDLSVRAKRDLFVFARAEATADGVEVRALTGRGSADVFAPAQANALLSFPAGSHSLAAGQEVVFRLLGPNPGMGPEETRR